MGRVIQDHERGGRRAEGDPPPGCGHHAGGVGGAGAGLDACGGHGWLSLGVVGVLLGVLPPYPYRSATVVLP
jgi:hypothetical protein